MFCFRITETPVCLKLAGWGDIFRFFLVLMHVYAYFMVMHLSCLCMSRQEDAVVDACWQFFLIVCHHDHRLVVALAERLDDVLHQTAVVIVETMQWLIQDEIGRASCRERV